MIGNYRNMRVALGHIFIRIKATLKHGEWERYYEKTFGTSIVTFRTAERYMLLAAKADSVAKNDRLTIFDQGVDPKSRETRAATAEAQAEIGNVATPAAIYRLPLHLSADQRDSTIRLWQSPYRRPAEKEVVAVLDKHLIKFRALKDDDADE